MEREQALLETYAMFSRDTAGRQFAEEPHPYRSPFQRDRDRILHCAAFRRLSGKMQVFTGDMGDHHRTRLTHTHEVAMIARTIGRVLRLNEDLIEALALLHDIGHPPFGHSGEDALHECMHDVGGFSHNRFAIVLAERLETRYTSYPGLNLTREVLLGQDFRVTHEGATPLLEVQVVDLADSIAYNAHDVDDALELGLLRLGQLESIDLVRRSMEWGKAKSHASTERAMRHSLVHSLIDVQIADLLETSLARLRDVRGLDCVAVREVGLSLDLSPILASEKAQLAQFLFDNVYRHPKLLEIRAKASQRVQALYSALVASPAILPRRFADYAQRVGVETAVGHYIAGMTDRFCDALYCSLVELGEAQTEDW